MKASCPKCKKPFDLKEHVCPNCGYALTTSQYKFRIFAWRLLCCSLVVLGLVLLLVFFAPEPDAQPQGEQEKTATSKSAASEDGVPFVTKESTEARALEVLIRDLWGKQTNWTPPKPTVIDISFTDLANNLGRAADIRVRIDDNLSGKMAGGKFLMDAGKLIQAVIKDARFKDITFIRIFGEMELVDKYGNVSEEAVTKAIMSRKVAEKINWDNVLLDNLPGLFTEDGGDFWMHPALKK